MSSNGRLGCVGRLLAYILLGSRLLTLPKEESCSKPDTTKDMSSE